MTQQRGNLVTLPQLSSGLFDNKPAAENKNISFFDLFVPNVDGAGQPSNYRCAWTIRAGRSGSGQQNIRIRYGDVFRRAAGNTYEEQLGSNFIILSEEENRVTSATIGDEISALPSASETLGKLIGQDAERIWRNLRIDVAEDETSERPQWEFEAFLERHGEAGVKALSAMLLGRLPAGEVSWKLLRMLSEGRDEATASARKDVVAACLESRDASLRYAAAGALVQFEKSFATKALQRRLSWEKNSSVRRMIEASLRR